MAAVIAKSSISAAVCRPARSSVRPMAALKPAVKAAPVAAPAQANQMMVWTPVNNKMFETFSYLPPLTDEDDGPEGSRHRMHAPQLDGKRLSLLFYADDISF
ncbi:hypothetical protein HXX76_005973 [Chlamydomonas incerta]|uniref:Uncharacterized protein n=1 Tax=Chlamydomonas incerta TaxID=51695 RepID=A0A835TFI3_CHLIN|nr:hypothetical protein HXX76_005973 [Chlamydomonas incerta]|eukprot:KAG2437316.1 hypothetical protein HXX76_005973 [Chlamydomonas incerta]